MVLGCGAHHGGSADVDLLDNIIVPRAAGDRLDERVQVDDDQLERFDAEVVELLLVGGKPQVGEKSGVD